MAKKTSAAAADALALLSQDHRNVEDLFRQFEKLEKDDEEAAAPVIESACMELQIHDSVEMEIFYPAVREAAPDDDEITDLLDEAEVEHEGVRDLIQKLRDMDVDDEKRKAHFTVLTEYVKHHVKEEEREMFPKLRKLKGLDLAALGAEMASHKAELTAAASADQH